jgi:hypothetical protein
VSSRTIMLDTNLLLLFVVGTTDRNAIGGHKRLSTYTPSDYDLLVAIIGNGPVLVTPHVLAETSNLLPVGVKEPRRSELLGMLKRLVATREERFVPARIVTDRPEYVRIGLTDAGLLEIADDRTELLTADWELHRAALAAGRNATNFHHLRDHLM